MAAYNGLLNEKDFTKSLSRALHTIKSGMKTGIDNLEMILDRHDQIDLGPMVEILNRCEIEYKQGNGKKIYSLDNMLDDYFLHPKEGVGKLLDKCKEMESLQVAYKNAEGWLRLLKFGRYSEATPPTDEEIFTEAVKYFAGTKDDSKIPETIYAAYFSDDSDNWIPSSNTYSRNFCSNKEIEDLNDRLEYEIHHTGNKNNVKEGHKNDLVKLREISADKFAYTRAEILGMLDLYKEYRSE